MSPIDSDIFARGNPQPPSKFKELNGPAWNALLEAYGYTWTDNFDLALIEGVRDGFFNPTQIEKHASELNDKVIATKADGSFEDAWRLYHDSFADNQEEVLDAIYASFMRNFRYVTPLNLNGTVMLFKELGRQNQAAEILKRYVDNRIEPRSFVDLQHYPFSGDITDPDVRQAFAEKCAELEEKLDVSAMLIGLKDSWTNETLVELAAVPVEEYRKAFKGTNGQDLRKMVAGVLQFDRIVNATAEMKEISKRAKEALKLIGAETPINARRVAKFGIKVEASADTALVEPGKIKPQP